jgi:hypothetical protein
MLLTQHANVRCRQRAIPPLLIDLLFQFGVSESLGEGVTKLFFDKVSRRKVKAYAGQLASLLDEHLNLYAVVGIDSEVITVGHRYERVRRH